MFRSIGKLFLRQLEVKFSGLIQVLLWLGLLSQLLILGITVLQERTPLLQEEIESRLSKILGKGLETKWDSVRIELSGNLYAQGFRIQDVATKENYLSVENLFIKLSWTDLIIGDPIPLEKLEGSGLQFYCPAVISPSGLNEVVVEDVDFTVKKSGNDITLQSLQFRFGEGQYFIEGSRTIDLSSGESPAESIRIKETYIGAVMKMSQILGLIPPELGRFQVNLSAHQLHDDFTSIRIRALAPQLSYREAALKNILAHLALTYHSGEIKIGSLGARADSFEYDQFQLKQPRVGLQNQTMNSLSIEDLFYGPFESGWIFSPEILVLGTEIGPSQLNFDRSNRGLDLSLNSTWFDNIGQITTSWIPGQSIGRKPIQFEIIADPEKLLARFRPIFKGKPIGDISFAPFNVEGFLLLKEDLRSLSYLQFDAALNGFLLGGNDYEVGRLGGHYDSPQLRVTDLRALRKTGEEIDGAYHHNLSTHEFALFAKGRAYPDTVGAYVGTWWDRIFKNIEPLEDPIEADVRVEGFWTDVTTLSGITGGIGRKVRYRDTVAEKLDVVVSHNFKEAFLRRCIAQQEVGKLDANLVWGLRHKKQGSVPYHLQFDSSLPWKELTGLVGSDYLSGLTAAGYPTIKGSGYIYKGPHGKPQFNRFEINFQNEDIVELGSKFDFRNLKFGAKLEKEKLRVKSFEGTLFEGNSSGNLTLNSIYDRSSKMKLSIQLSQGDYQVLYTSLNPIEKPRATGTPLPEGIIDFRLSMESPLDEWMAGESEGYFKIVESNFGTIRLFGELSRLFESLGMRFSSVNIDSAQGSWIQTPYKITVPKILVNGPSLDLDAKGVILLPNYGLQFEVEAFAVRNLVGLVLSPISSNLKFSLVGTAAAPQWKFGISPFQWLKPKN